MGSRHSRLTWSLFAVAAWPLTACDAPRAEVSSSSASLVTAGGTGASGLLGEDPIDFLQRVPVAAAGATPVLLETGRSVRVDLAAAEVLAEHRGLVEELKLGAHALYGNVETLEEFIETEHTLILQSRTRFVVEDPAALRAASPRMAGVRIGGGQHPKLAELTPADRALLRAGRDRVLAQPADHPLGKAARKSEEAFWEAVMTGAGDVTVTTRVSVPKREPAHDGLTLMAPNVVDGVPDHTQTHMLAMPASTSENNGSPSTGPVLSGASGERTTRSKFVNGFTKSDGVHFEDDWDFVIGHLLVRAGATYAVGVRAPIVVKATVSPTTIGQLGGTTDRPAEFATELEVEVRDEDEDFYHEAGVHHDDLYDGKELVLNAEAYAHIDADLIGLHGSWDLGRGTDWGQHFTPPLGDCGTECGFEAWVPSWLTNTDVNILGIIKGSAQVGVKVSGDGEVDLSYSSFDGDEVARSTRGTGAGRQEHRLSFDGPETKTLTAPLSPLAEPGSKTFGYRVSDLDYAWTVKLYPGVKGTIEVDCGPIFQTKVTIGPFWAEFASLTVGTFHLGPHDGTHASYEVRPGEKEWRVITSEMLAPVGTGDGDARPSTEISETEGTGGAFCFAEGSCPTITSADDVWIFSDGETPSMVELGGTEPGNEELLLP